MRQVNLLPDEFQREMRMEALTRTCVMSIIVVCLILIPVHLWLGGKVKRLEQSALTMKLSRAMPELTQVRSAVDGLRRQRDAFVAANRVLLQLAAQRLQYRDALRLIGETAFTRVWCTQITFNAQRRTLEMQGNSFDAQLVSEFLLELKKSPHFSDVDMTSMQSQTGTGSTKISFTLTCTFA